MIIIQADGLLSLQTLQLNYIHKLALLKRRLALPPVFYIVVSRILPSNQNQSSCTYILTFFLKPFNASCKNHTTTTTTTTPRRFPHDFATAARANRFEFSAERTGVRSFEK